MQLPRADQPGNIDWSRDFRSIDISPAQRTVQEVAFLCLASLPVICVSSYVWGLGLLGKGIVCLSSYFLVTQGNRESPITNEQDLVGYLKMSRRTEFIFAAMIVGCLACSVFQVHTLFFATSGATDFITFLKTVKELSFIAGYFIPLLRGVSQRLYHEDLTFEKTYNRLQTLQGNPRFLSINSMAEAMDPSNRAVSASLQNRVMRLQENLESVEGCFSEGECIAGEIEGDISVEWLEHLFREIVRLESELKDQIDSAGSPKSLEEYKGWKEGLVALKASLVPLLEKHFNEQELKMLRQAGKRAFECLDGHYGGLDGLEFGWEGSPERCSRKLFLDIGLVTEGDLYQAGILEDPERFGANNGPEAVKERITNYVKKFHLSEKSIQDRVIYTIFMASIVFCKYAANSGIVPFEAVFFAALGFLLYRKSCIECMVFIQSCFITPNIAKNLIRIDLQRECFGDFLEFCAENPYYNYLFPEAELLHQKGISSKMSFESWARKIAFWLTLLGVQESAENLAKDLMERGFRSEGHFKYFWFFFEFIVEFLPFLCEFFSNLGLLSQVENALTSLFETQERQVPGEWQQEGPMRLSPNREEPMPRVEEQQVEG